MRPKSNYWHQHQMVHLGESHYKSLFKEHHVYSKAWRWQHPVVRCFSTAQTGALVRTQGITDGVKYLKILEQKCYPLPKSCQWEEGSRLTGNTVGTKMWMSLHGLVRAWSQTLLNWRYLQSKGHHPIWLSLTSSVKRRGCRCTTLVEIYPNRLKAAIKAKGSSTKWGHRVGNPLFIYLILFSFFLYFLNCCIISFPWIFISCIQSVLVCVCLHFMLQSNKMWKCWRGWFFSIATVYFSSCYIVADKAQLLTKLLASVSNIKGCIKSANLRTGATVSFSFKASKQLWRSVSHSTCPRGFASINIKIVLWSSCLR